MVGSSRQITVCHLYRSEMNIYGDTGNILSLQWRMEQRGIKVKNIVCGVGDKIPSDVDIIFSGGGQDSGQYKVKDDLAKKRSTLLSFHKDGKVMLTICGMFQLFGHSFETQDGVIEGVSIFDMVTVAGPDRLIGNVLVESDKYGRLVGFENHSGRTTLANRNMSLGKVLKGAGNNGMDGTEGAESNNVFGTYLHGPLLPKNPVLADEIIRRALDLKYGAKVDLVKIDDKYAHKAASIASRLRR